MHARTTHMAPALDRLEGQRGDNRHRGRVALCGLAIVTPKGVVDVLSVSDEAKARVAPGAANTHARGSITATRVGAVEIIVRRGSRRLEADGVGRSFEHSSVVIDEKPGSSGSASETLSGHTGADTIADARIEAILDGRCGTRGVHRTLHAAGRSDLVRIMGMSIDPITLGAGNDVLTGAADFAKGVRGGAGDDAFGVSARMAWASGDGRGRAIVAQGAPVDIRA
jgi:Ca2+-binding RTX toxin-like protein